MDAGYSDASGGTSPGEGLDEYDFELPEAQIATAPAEARGGSRLLVVEGDGRLLDKGFAEILELLRPGDLLVANNVRVCAWRLDARRPGTGAGPGAKIELLLLGSPAQGDVEAMCRPAKRVVPGETLELADGGRALVLAREAGRCRLRFEAGAAGGGRLPLPPYIVQQRRKRGLAEELPLDGERYQTVYASVEGAVAAPTAGLHFTRELIEGLRGRGVGWAELSLLVGPGTFEPVKAERISEHRVEPERYSIPAETWARIEECRARGGAVVAVGTTTCRALEAAAREGALEGQADLTILPGRHRFRLVDALVTNFHLPRSSLLLLVSAFAGRETILAAYRHAVAGGYRFYSYGDAMLLDRRRLDARS